MGWVRAVLGEDIFCSNLDSNKEVSVFKNNKTIKLHRHQQYGIAAIAIEPFIGLCNEDQDSLTCARSCRAKRFKSFPAHSSTPRFDFQDQVYWSQAHGGRSGCYD